MKELLLSALPVAFSSFAVAFVLSAAYRRSLHNPSDGHLKYGTAIQAIGWISVAIALVVAVLTLLLDNDEKLAMFGIVAMFSVLGTYLLLETILTVGHVDAMGISIKNIWGTKRGRWEDLRKAEFKKNGQYFVLEFGEGSQVKFSRLLMGHMAVCKHVETLGVEVTGMSDYYRASRP